jgi:hypothetical protein
MVSRALALVGPTYDDRCLPITSSVMMAAAFFSRNHRDYKPTRLIRFFLLTFRRLDGFVVMFVIPIFPAVTPYVLEGLG